MKLKMNATIRSGKKNFSICIALEVRSQSKLKTKYQVFYHFKCMNFASINLQIEVELTCE